MLAPSLILLFDKIKKKGKLGNTRFGLDEGCIVELKVPYNLNKILNIEDKEIALKLGKKKKKISNFNMRTCSSQFRSLIKKIYSKKGAFDESSFNLDRVIHC